MPSNSMSSYSSSDDDSTSKQLNLLEEKLKRRRQQAQEEDSSDTSDDESIIDLHSKRFVKRQASSSSSSDSDNDSPDGRVDRKASLLRVKKENSRRKGVSSSISAAAELTPLPKRGQAPRSTGDISPLTSEASLTPPPSALVNRRAATSNNSDNRMSNGRNVNARGPKMPPPNSKGTPSLCSSASTNSNWPQNGASASVKRVNNPYKKVVRNPYARKKTTNSSYLSKNLKIQPSQSPACSTPKTPSSAQLSLAVTPKTPASAQSTSSSSTLLTPVPLSEADDDRSPKRGTSSSSTLHAPVPLSDAHERLPKSGTFPKESSPSSSSSSGSSSSSSSSSDSSTSSNEITPPTKTQRKNDTTTSAQPATNAPPNESTVAVPKEVNATNQNMLMADDFSFFDMDSDDDMAGDNQDTNGAKSSFFSSMEGSSKNALQSNSQTSAPKADPNEGSKNVSQRHSQKNNTGGILTDKTEAALLDFMEESSLMENDEGIIDFAAQNDSRAREIEPALYAPPQCEPSPDPIVHTYNLGNRPMQMRQQTPVDQVFPSPINQFWRSKFQTFNHLQSEVVNVLAHSNDNFLVSSPTGSGKSTIFDIAMARLLLHDLHSQSKAANQQQRRRVISRQRKMVYVAPSKALCEERYADWRRRLSALNLGIEVAMITGDAEPGEAYRDLASAHFIVTTPEKFDSLSRRWTENFYLFASIKLFMVDEVHLVGDASRGWCLEAIICRIKTIQRAASNVTVSQTELLSSSYPNTTPEAIASSLRIVAVSATLPNIQDCAALISAAECYTFDQSYRPVPLKTHVVGLGYIGKNAFQFWNNLDRRVPELIQRFSDGKPTIVFCHSKKDTEKLADSLARALGTRSSQSRQGQRQEMAQQTRNRGLKAPLTMGMAYHHAGLDAQDRRLVEEGFSKGNIQVLCATSTLAMGVNLPVHLVIIKGTMAWRGAAGYQDLDAATILQMTGRAGRPGYDTSGTAVIMCDNQSKKRVEKLSSGLGPVESQLETKLSEVLNSEISQSAILSTRSALDWIKGTLYYTRIKKYPQRFGIKDNSDQSVDAYLLYKLETCLQKLKTMGFIVDKGSQGLQPLATSLIMAKNLVDMQSAELMAGLPSDASMCQVLTAICQIEDLQRPVRRMEKSKLNEAQKQIKYKLDGPPSKVRVKTPQEKCFVLLQAAIGQIYLEDWTLRQEMTSMIEYASRMLTALEEFSARGSRHGHVAAQSLKLRRCLATSLWGEHDGVLNSLRGVGQQTTTSLKMNGIVTFRHVQQKSAEDIEAACKRPAPFGQQLKQAVEKIFNSSMKLSAAFVDAGGGSPHVVCTLEPQNPMNNSTGSSEQAVVTYTLIAYTDKPGSCLYYQDNISSPEEIKFRCPKHVGLLVIQLIASMIGLDEKIELKGDDTIESNFFTKARGCKGSDTVPKNGRQTKIRSITKSRARPTDPATAGPSSSSTAKKERGQSDKENRQSSTRKTSIASLFSQVPPPSKRAKATPAQERPALQPTNANHSSHWQGIDSRQAVHTKFKNTVGIHREKQSPQAPESSLPVTLGCGHQEAPTQSQAASTHPPRQHHGGIHMASSQNRQFRQPRVSQSQSLDFQQGAYQRPPSPSHQPNPPSQFPSGTYQAHQGQSSSLPPQSQAQGAQGAYQTHQGQSSLLSQQADSLSQLHNPSHGAHQGQSSLPHHSQAQSNFGPHGSYQGQSSLLQQQADSLSQLDNPSNGAHQAQSLSAPPHSQPQSPFGQHGTYQGGASSSLPINGTYQDHAELSLPQHPHHESDRPGFPNNQMIPQSQNLPGSPGPAFGSERRSSEGWSSSSATNGPSRSPCAASAQRKSGSNSSTKRSETKSWRMEKRQQEKSQVRAFTRKKENPFSSFKHDPNDAEGILDSLNSEESSIIPRQEIDALRSKRPRGVLVAKRFGARHSRGRGGRAFPSQHVNERELMSIKAAEAASYSGMARNRHVSPNPQMTRPNWQPVTPAGNVSVVTVDHEQRPNRLSLQPPGYQNRPYLQDQSFGNTWDQTQADFNSTMPSQGFRPGDGLLSQNPWEQQQEWNMMESSSFLAPDHSYQGVQQMASLSGPSMQPALQRSFGQHVGQPPLPVTMAPYYGGQVQASQQPNPPAGNYGFEEAFF